MIKQRLALGLATITMGAIGCGPGETAGTLFDERDFVCEDGVAAPCETTAPANTDQERTVVEPEGDAATYTFIVNTLSIPEASGGVAAGFNLDNINSGMGSSATDATCEEFVPDYVSEIDSGHIGVDNALQGLLGTIESFLDAADCPGMTTEGCLDALVQEQVNEGSVLLLLEVSNVNDLNYDSDVTLQLVMGTLGTGSATACTTDAECTVAGETCVDMACDFAPMLDGSDHIAAGQTFMRAMNLGSAVPGDIFNGRLRAAAEIINIAIDAADLGVIELPISSPEVRFDISETGATAGMIGGFIFNADIIEIASAIAPGMEGTVMALVEQIADVSPSSGDPMVCEAISVGITFSGVTATIQ